MRVSEDLKPKKMFWLKVSFEMSDICELHFEIHLFFEMWDVYSMEC